MTNIRKANCVHLMAYGDGKTCFQRDTIYVIDKPLCNFSENVRSLQPEVHQTHTANLRHELCPCVADNRHLWSDSQTHRKSILARLSLDLAELQAEPTYHQCEQAVPRIVHQTVLQQLRPAYLLDAVKFAPSLEIIFKSDIFLDLLKNTLQLSS